MYFYKLFALILLATIAVSDGTEIEVINLNVLFTFFVRLVIWFILAGFR